MSREGYVRRGHVPKKLAPGWRRLPGLWVPLKAEPDRGDVPAILAAVEEALLEVLPVAGRPRLMPMLTKRAALALVVLGLAGTAQAQMPPFSIGDSPIRQGHREDSVVVDPRSGQQLPLHAPGARSSSSVVVDSITGQILPLEAPREDEDDE